MDGSASGRSPRSVVALTMAICGAMFFSVFLKEDMSNMGASEWSDLPWGLILRYVVAMAIGGALAGALLAGLFGRDGILGWALAAIGGVLATLMAGLLGSAAGLVPDLFADGWQTGELIQIFAGLLVIPLSFAGNAWLVPIWLVLLAAAHILAKKARSSA